MRPQKDIQLINTGTTEKTIKSDLSVTKTSGLIYWRGVPLDNFSKNQLMKIIYLLMEND